MCMIIERVEAESKSEMIATMMRSKRKYIILGRDSEVENKFYILWCCSNESKEFAIGIITEGHGVTPEYKCIGDDILIGFNREVNIIDSNGDCKTTVKADYSVFFEFADANNPEEIIAIFEAEVICFSIEGSKKWVYLADDIITDYYTDDNRKMYITKYEGERTTISLLSGNVIDAS